MLFGRQAFSSIVDDKTTPVLFELTFGQYFSTTYTFHRVLAYNGCAETHLGAELDASADNSERIGGRRAVRHEATMKPLSADEFIQQTPSRKPRAKARLSVDMSAGANIDKYSALRPTPVPIDCDVPIIVAGNDHASKRKSLQRYWCETAQVFRSMAGGINVGRRDQ
jgi:hypothetical protein